MWEAGSTLANGARSPSGKRAILVKDNPGAHCGQEPALERLHRDQGKIVHQADLLLHEGLAIQNACKQTVMTGFRERPFPNLLFRNKQSAPRRLIRILRSIGHQGSMPLLDKRR